MNNGVVSVPPLKLNAPEGNIKLVEQLIVPDVNVNVLRAVIFQVVQEIVPILFNVPRVYVTAAEQVKLNEAKLIVPAVMVKVVLRAAAVRVVVPAPLLIVNGPILLPLQFILPVPSMFIVI